MQVLIDIPEAARPGITAARAARNSTLPATVMDGENEVPNPDLIASDEDYITWVIGRAVDSYNASAGTPAPAPTPNPAVINGVPQEVTRRQARSALALAGKLDLVQGCIDMIADPTQRELVQIEWDDSQTFMRTRPTLVSLATSPAPYGLAMTVEELDAMFVQAAAL